MVAHKKYKTISNITPLSQVGLPSNVNHTMHVNERGVGMPEEWINNLKDQVILHLLHTRNDLMTIMTIMTIMTMMTIKQIWVENLFWVEKIFWFIFYFF